MINNGRMDLVFHHLKIVQLNSTFSIDIFIPILCCFKTLEVYYYYIVHILIFGPNNYPAKVIGLHALTNNPPYQKLEQCLYNVYEV